MPAKWRAGVLGVSLTLAIATIWLLAADKTPQKVRRDSAQQTFQAGNFKDAYQALRTLALDPQADPLQVGSDLRTALTCLQRLGRANEIDAFREAVIRVHARNWRLLET